MDSPTAFILDASARNTLSALFADLYSAALSALHFLASALSAKLHITLYLPIGNSDCADAANTTYGFFDNFFSFFAMSSAPSALYLDSSSDSCPSLDMFFLMPSLVTTIAVGPENECASLNHSLDRSFPSEST